MRNLSSYSIWLKPAFVTPNLQLKLEAIQRKAALQSPLYRYDLKGQGFGAAANDYFVFDTRLHFA